MKMTDWDLEQMFKREQDHSVAAACRAIYEAGFDAGMKTLADGMVNGAAGPHDNWASNIKRHPVTEGVNDLLVAASVADWAAAPRPTPGV